MPMNKDNAPERVRASPSDSGRVPLSLPTFALPRGAREKLAPDGDTNAVPKISLETPEGPIPFSSSGYRVSRSVCTITARTKNPSRHLLSSTFQLPITLPAKVKRAAPQPRPAPVAQRRRGCEVPR